MAARLKVFRWSDGFHAFSVAVSSRQKALQAWGSSQDLFATGLASEIKQGPDFETALTAPGKVIRRGEAIDIGKFSTVSKPRARPGPSAAQERRIAALEVDVAQIERDREETLAAIDDQIRVLQIDRSLAETAFSEQLEKASKKLEKARKP